jgi:hypothetical protein
MSSGRGAAGRQSTAVLERLALGRGPRVGGQLGEGVQRRVHELTESGAALMPVLEQLSRWAADDLGEGCSAESAG